MRGRLRRSGGRTSLVSEQARAPVVPAAATRRHALRDVAVQVLARVLNLALGVVVTVLLVRTLGRGPYGQWVTLLATYQLLGFLTSLGLEAVTVREATNDPARAPEWIGALLVTRAALTLPVIVAGLVVLVLIREGDEMLVAGLVLLLQFPLSIGSSFQVVHQLRVSNGVPMIVLTINSVVWGLLVVFISIAGGGLVAVACALTFSSAMTSAIQAMAALRIVGLRLRPSRAAIMRLVRVGAPLGLAGLLVNAYARIDQLIVFEVSGSVAAGLYGSVYRLLDSAHFVPIAALTTLAPILAAAWPADRERTLRLAGLAAEFLAVGSLGALAFASVGSSAIVQALFGPEYAQAATALPVLGAAFVFICFGYLTGNLLLVLGIARRQLVVALVGLVVNVAGNLVLVPRYGFMGAAWMTLATEVVVVVISAVFVIRALEIRALSLTPMVRILTAAALLTLALLGVRAIHESVVLLGVASAVLYPLLLLGLGAVRLTDLQMVLSRPAPAA